MNDLDRKLKKLKKIISECESVLVAFSGGVDSTLLLKVAVDVLGEKVLAVTFSGEMHSPEEVGEAAEIAGSLGVRHLIVEQEGSGSPEFVSNPPDRCYYCKKKGFGVLFSIAGDYGMKVVADGLNADDLLDYRPGRRAGEELGVLSPLKEAGLTKAEIRALSREFRLPNAEKPASPCFASRFPYGTAITSEGLRQVKAAEETLLKMGIPQVRVRHHGSLARIEVPGEYIGCIVENAAYLVQTFKKIGYVYITLDLQGYRTGSMNETLEREGK